MANISAELQSILNDAYGSIVRIAVHDGIEKVNKLGTLNGKSDTKYNSDMVDSNSEFTSSGGELANQSQVNSLISAIEELENLVAKAEAKLDGYISQIATNDGRIRALQNRFANQQVKLNNLQSTISSMSTQ